MSAPLAFFSLNCEGDKHLPAILAMIHTLQPDVLCLQEVFEQDWEMLKNELGMDGVFAPMANVTTQNKYGVATRGRWGATILTNLPFEDARYEYYKGSGDHLPPYTDEPNNVNRVLVTLRAEKDGVVFDVATTHFTWSMAGETNEDQRRDFAKLSQLLAKTPELVLAGDFNAPRGLEIFTELSKRYVDNIPQDVKTSLDPVLHRVKDKQLMIDGLFTSPAYRVNSVRMLTGISDHQGIFAQISKLETD